MKWHLYKRGCPKTWPQIDCPIVVYKRSRGIEGIEICNYNKQSNEFSHPNGHHFRYDSCYYAYIDYIPNGYKTRKVTKCAGDNECEWHDDGYCLLKRKKCKHKRSVDEYRIEEQAIWKKFE